VERALRRAFIASGGSRTLHPDVTTCRRRWQRGASESASIALLQTAEETSQRLFLCIHSSGGRSHLYVDGSRVAEIEPCGNHRLRAESSVHGGRPSQFQSGGRASLRKWQWCEL